MLSAPPSPVLLDVRDLKVHFHTHRGIVRAVDGVDLRMGQERTLGVVGESGCGKSVTAAAMLGLVPRPPARISGEIVFQQRDGRRVEINGLHPRGAAIRHIRGGEMAMIFQEPMTSLNPVLTVGDQIVETIVTHQSVSKREAQRRAVEMLDRVGIPSPDKRINDHPHHMSGGMRQRVMIGMALSCNPSLLVADEPTTALDVTIQAQILELMAQLKHEFRTSILLITHDLGVVAEMADDVAVMYLGQIVEYGPMRRVFKSHGHPYTEGLLNSVPVLGRRVAAADGPIRRRLVPISGVVPDARHIPSGCRFAPRCPYRFDRCSVQPPLVQVAAGHQVRCWLPRATGTAARGEGPVA